MSETQLPEIPHVQDKRPKIAGLLPKNTQARVLGAIALLMVLVMILSGRHSPKKPAAASPMSLIVDPNQARIQDYRTRIAEEAQKLAAEEAQLAQTKQAVGVRLRAPAVSSTGAVRPPACAMDRSEAQKSWIEIEKEKREYQALYA